MNDTEAWLTTRLDEMAGDGTGPAVSIDYLIQRRRQSRLRRLTVVAAVVLVAIGGGLAARAMPSTVNSAASATANVTLVVTYSGGVLPGSRFRYTSPHDVALAAQTSHCHAYWLNSTNQGGSVQVEVRLLLPGDLAKKHLRAIQALAGVKQVRQLPASTFNTAPQGPGRVRGPLDCLPGTLPSGP